MIVDAGAIAYLTQMILNNNGKHKRQVFSALTHIAKHSVYLAEMVVEVKFFPAVLACLQDNDDYVKNNVATLIREITKRTPDLSLKILYASGIAAVIDYVSNSKGKFSSTWYKNAGLFWRSFQKFGYCMIVSRGIDHLAVSISGKSDGLVLAAKFWYLRQIGRHTLDHAKAVAPYIVSPKLLKCYIRTNASEDIQKAKSLRAVCKNVHLPALEPLLHDAQLNVMKHVVAQFSTVFTHDVKARKKFVTGSGLKKVRTIKAEPGSA